MKLVDYEVRWTETLGARLIENSCFMFNGEVDLFFDPIRLEYKGRIVNSSMLMLSPVIEGDADVSSG
jgi:hypothetical protein